tara:strand:+ start:434 stop:574 length:141 start_codon:yes stop_codon:yes gene_type:complete
MKRKYININDKEEIDLINKIQKIKLEENNKNIIKKDNSFLLLYGLI